jgi:WD repeat-containing protein 45
MGGLLPKYFKSEWSYAQFRIGDGRALCAFSEDGQNLIAVNTEGTYFLAEIPKGGGECKEISRKTLS